MIDTLAAVLRATVVEHVRLTSDKFSACDGKLTFSWYRNDYLDARTDGFDTIHCEDPDVSMSHCMVFAGAGERLNHLLFVGAFFLPLFCFCFVHCATVVTEGLQVFGERSSKAILRRVVSCRRWRLLLFYRKRDWNGPVFMCPSGRCLVITTIYCQISAKLSLATMALKHI